MYYLLYGSPYRYESYYGHTLVCSNLIVVCFNFEATSTSLELIHVPITYICDFMSKHMCMLCKISLRLAGSCECDSLQGAAFVIYFLQYILWVYI